MYVPDEQVCASTPSADLKPHDSQYTGYMGNYGNTMDRRYRRAAVVVWSRQHAFTARAEASPSWALAELRARLGAGDLAGARAAAGSVTPFWKVPGPELLEPALHTAAGLADPGIALMLLRPFAVEWVTPAHAGGLAALAARYGESWHRDLLDAWFGSRNTWRYTGDVDREGWAGVLPGLTVALRDAGATAAAGWLLAASWGWLDDDIRLWLRYPSPVTRRKQLAELGKQLAELGKPLAEARRKHVKDQISSAELPVKHETWKFGSPHTLVLTKTDELFQREAKARKDATASLEWLAAQRRR